MKWRPKMKQRTTTPKNNKYYITKGSGGLNGAIEGKPTQKGANVLDNCVGFCNGRFAESQNDPDLKGVYKAFKYQLVCDAEDFIESAKRQGLKISRTPIEGGIMVWQKGSTLSPHDGAGHVAFVEAVYDDGTILTSESGWLSWAFKLVRRDNKNGRWGQNSAYKFRGCIINPSIANPKVVPVPPLTVDGIGGPDTIRALQHFVGTPEDGEISGQTKGLAKWHPALKAVTYGSGGSVCVKAVQKWLGITADGQWGKGTSKALQHVIGVDDDGIFGPASMKALQKYLNVHDKADPSAGVPTLNKGKVIDVSEFQEKIDWNKVKESGIVGAIIRCGFRGAEKGTLNTDAHFFEHIKGAHAAGLKVGIYMFTEGINAAEGAAEADYAVQLAQKAGIPLSYPIAVDTEAVYYIKSGRKCDGRANKLSKAKRTEVIKAFCERIKALGFEPMIYASTSWLINKLDMAQLPYKVWVAQYNTVCEYKGEYVLWQYTSQGSVPGINGNVDMNECYLKDTEPVDPKPVKVEYPELGKEALIKVADAVVLACDEIAFPYSTPESKTKYNHAKDYKITKYDSDRPTAANKAAFDKIFPNHWKWGSEKYGYGQRVNACCDDFAALIVRYSGADPKCPHAVDVVARGDWNPKNFTKKKYTDKSQLVRGSVLSYFKHGSGGHMMIIYSSNRRCDAGLNHFYGKIRSMGSKFWDFKKTIQSGYIYTPKDKYISITRAYLCKGMVSDEVRKLQKLLGVDDDSIFGPMTEKAVKAFQKENGLVEDGVFGAKSLAKLMERGTA